MGGFNRYISDIFDRINNRILKEKTSGLFFLNSSLLCYKLKKRDKRFKKNFRMRGQDKIGQESQHF